MKAIPLVIVILILAVGLYFGLREQPGEEKPDGGADPAEGPRDSTSAGDREVGPPRGSPREAGGTGKPASAPPKSGGETEPMTVEEYVEGIRRREKEEAARSEPPLPEAAKVKELGPIELLKQAKVSLELTDVSALVALASIAAEAGVRIDMEKDLRDMLEKADLSLSLAEATGDNALELVLMLAAPDLTFAARDGKIVIHRRE